MKKRVKQLFSKLENIDAVLIRNKYPLSDPNFVYFANMKREDIKGYLNHDVFLILRPDCTADIVEAEEIKSHVVKYDSIGMNFPYITASDYLKVRKIVGHEPIDVSKELEEIKLIKDCEEIKNIKRSCEISDKIFAQINELVDENKDEEDVLDEIEYLAKKNGSDGMAFKSSIAFGKNTSIYNYRAGNKKIKEGDAIIIDIGPIYNFYASDSSRVFAFKRASKNMKKIEEKVINLQDLVFNAIKSDARNKDVCELVMKKIGDDRKLLRHCFGHDVGLTFPYSFKKTKKIDPAFDFTFKEDMIFAVEMGLYDENIGLRIEDTVRVKKGGVEPLTKYPRFIEVIR
jgi:Xaa-Pro dipeptidase